MCCDESRPPGHDGGMMDPPTPPGARVKRRGLAEIFGDVLPDTTSDERGNECGGTDESDRWYVENRPPHHGER
jgi:hypothetical protein